MLIDNQTLKTVGVGAAVAVAAAWYMQRGRARRVGEAIPSEWLEVGTVDQLLLYPLKSGAPIKCTEFLCTQQGPFYNGSRDRVVAVVKEDGTLVTGRDFPQLTQVAAEVKDHVLTLTAPLNPSFSLNLAPLQDNRKLQYLKIWESHSEGVDCGEEVAAYLSKYLNFSVRLLFFPHRQQGKDVYRAFLEMPYIYNTDGGIFSDAMSFHIVNQASVADLNSRLETPVEARNFRPNIIISGEKLLPYEEDSWQYIRVGNVVFRNLAPCTRCLMTTINPDTGEKSETYEPLKTLRKYRVLREPSQKALFGVAPVMGVFLGMRKEGVIRAGDTVSVGLTSK